MRRQLEWPSLFVSCSPAMLRSEWVVIVESVPLTFACTDRLEPTLSTQASNIGDNQVASSILSSHVRG